MAYGENYDYTTGNGYITVHAEEHALRKLPSAPPRKKKQKVDILVIRTTHTGHMGLSRPCLRCTLLLYSELPSRGYTLGSIYYSVAHEVIAKTTIEQLVAGHREDPHITQYYRNRNMKPI